MVGDKRILKSRAFDVEGRKEEGGRRGSEGSGRSEGVGTDRMGRRIVTVVRSREELKLRIES